MKEQKILALYIPIGVSATSYLAEKMPHLGSCIDLIKNTPYDKLNEIIQSLLPNPELVPVIFFCVIERGHLDLTRVLIDQLSDPAYIVQGISFAALCNQVPIVKYFTEKYKLDFSEATLYNAAHSCSMDIIEYLKEIYPKEMTTYEMIQNLLITAQRNKSIIAIDILSDLLQHAPQPVIEISEINKDNIKNLYFTDLIDERIRIYRKQKEEEKNAREKEELENKIEEEQREIQLAYRQSMERSAEIKELTEIHNEDDDMITLSSENSFESDHDGDDDNDSHDSDKI